MRTIKPIKARFRELQESKTYRESFESLKREILSLKLTSKEEGWKLPTFFKAEFEKKEFKFRDWTHLKLKEVQKILKNGNVNEHWIKIPDDFSDFREEWGVQYFFDPGKSFFGEFNPCWDTNPAVVRRFFLTQEYKPYKLTLEIDLRYPRTFLKRKIDRLIQIFQEKQKLTGRVEKYTDDEILRVTAMRQQGMKGIEIYQKLENCHFNPREDYLFKPEGDRTLVDYERWKGYQRILRLIRRTKELKP